MQFPLEPSRLTNVIKTAFTSVFALAIFAACSDTVSAPEPGGITSSDIFVVETQVPDAEKNPSLAPEGSMQKAPASASLSLGVNPSAAFGMLAASGKYSVSSVPFEPEPAPTASLGPNCDDCVMFRVPLGFEFVYYGMVYSSLNISSNGFVGFGTTLGNGCCKGGAIPSPDVTNNIIALGWSDWQPQLNPGSIRYETRGTAPNRRFVLQFTNVREYMSTGRLTAQLVLAEETHEITIYSTNVSTFRSDHLITQGIENLAGTEAAFVPGRVRGFFKLANDAVRFTPAPNERPVLTVPANISLVLDIGSCAVSVDPGSPSATDDTEGFSMLPPVRSDALALDAPYPGGVTTIVWTVEDAGGLKTSGTQTIHVQDKENPSITAPASISADNDPGMGSAAVSAGSAVGTDNCPNLAISGARSDGAVLSAPFPVGVTTITWTAADQAGNSVTAAQTVRVNDVEAPTFSSLADISLDATSRSGAVVSFATSFSDNVAVVKVDCSRESGSVFPAGQTTVTCTAYDAAGNSASDSFVVAVRGAAEQLVSLIGDIEDLNLSGGTANPMVNQLLAALRDVENEGGASCKKIDDYIKMLTERKKSSEISSADVLAMLEDARRIKSVLGCP